MKLMSVCIVVQATAQLQTGANGEQFHQLTWYKGRFSLKIHKVNKLSAVSI